MVEKHLHNIFTDLADKRVRPSREFFNISPDQALVYLKQEAELLSDAILNIPDEEFYFNKPTTDARMKVVDGNKYIVLAGSQIDLKIYSNRENVMKLRDGNKDSLDGNVTIKDIEFTSPSTAGQFVGGGSCNGKVYWRTKTNKPLEKFIEYNN